MSNPTTLREALEQVQAAILPLTDPWQLKDKDIEAIAEIILQTLHTVVTPRQPVAIAGMLLAILKLADGGLTMTGKIEKVGKLTLESQLKEATNTFGMTDLELFINQVMADKADQTSKKDMN